MNKKKNLSSIDVAADMLNGLPKGQKDKVLELMMQKDPHMASLIKEHLFRFEQLTLMTPKMLPDFLKAVKLKDLALALKLEDQKIQLFFLESLSTRMSEELKDLMENTKVPRSQAEEASQKIKDICIDLINKGVLVLDAKGDEFV